MLNLQRLATLFEATDDTRPVIVSPDINLTYGELQDRIMQRQKMFLQQGIEPDDIALLAVTGAVEDLINLLSLLALGTPTLVHQPQPGQVIDQFLHAQATVRIHGSVQRIRMPAQPLTDSRPALATLSSGSTGVAKIIWHSLSGLAASASAANQLLPLTAESRCLVSLPLYHVGGLGLVLRALLAGASLIFQARADHPDSYRQLAISRVSLVPTQLYRLLQSGLQGPSECQVLLGGAPIPDQLLADARAHGWNIHRSYGLSEMASQVLTEVTPNHWQILPHARIQIIGGEILVKGDSLFLGYGSAEAPERALTAAGYFATGDLVSWQRQQFRFIGRRDNRFISGGENITPEQIEQVLLNSNLIAEVVVLPLPDAEWGQLCTAMVRPAPGFNLSDFQQYIRQNLSAHEQPRKLFYWRESAGMKIQRQQLIQWVSRHDLEEIL